MSQKAAPRKLRKKAREQDKTDPEGLPKRTYKFLSKPYSSLNLNTSSVLIAAERIKVLRKLGISNTKFLRKVKLARYVGRENFWPVYLRSLVLVRGDLRVLEFDNFSWKDFYAKSDLRHILNVILGKSKRLKTLNANFIVEDRKQLRKLKRYRELREISIKAQGTHLSYHRLQKALSPRMPVNKLNINFSRCIEIQEPEKLAVAISRLVNLKQLNLFFDLPENRESQTFNTTVLSSVIPLLYCLDIPSLFRVQLAAKEIIKICMQRADCAETAAKFFDVIYKLVNKAGKKVLTPAIEALDEDFEVVELEYLHRHISANMIANEIRLLQKVNILTMFHRKNEHLDIIEKSGEDTLDVDKLGVFISEEVAIEKELFKKFTNVKEVDLYIKYESCRHKALDSLLRFARDNFQAIRLKLVLSWELIMKENEFEDFIFGLSQIEKLKFLDLSIFANYFGKRRFAALGRLENSASLKEYTLSLRCYIKSVSNENLLQFFKKAKKLRSFKLLDYTPIHKYDRKVLHEILGRTTNLEVINIE